MAILTMDQTSCVVVMAVSIRAPVRVRAWLRAWAA